MELDDAERSAILEDLAATKSGFGLEGPGDTWKSVRLMMGTTNPLEAAPGTIRGDLGTLFTENLVHGSDSLESAEREIGIFFPDL